MANAELSVSDLMQFLPDFRELLDITEIAFSLLAKSVIRVDQSVGLTSGEKVERLMKLLQVLEVSTSKPSGVYYFIVSLRETGERKNIKGHIDLLSKISKTFPALDIEGCNDEDCDDIAPENTVTETGPILRNLDDTNRQGLITKDCDAQVVLPPRPKPSSSRRKLPKSPPVSETDMDSDPNMYEGVTPAKSKDHTEKSASALPPIPPPKLPTPSLPPKLPSPPRPVVPSSIPAKGLSKVDNDVEEVYEPWEVYEAWPAATVDNHSKSHNGNIEEELYNLVSALQPKVLDEYEEIDNWTADKPPPSPSNHPSPAKEDDYQELETVLSSSNKQKESFQSLIKQKQSSDNNEEDPEDYYPTADDDNGDDYPDDRDLYDDVNDDGKLTLKKSHETVPRGSSKSPASSTTSAGSEIHSGLLAAPEISIKDNDATERSQDVSTSEMTVTELLQSITAERESIVKMAETQKSQLKSDLLKKHELEMKELHLKYKSKIKKLQLKQKEDGMAMKVVMEKLQSELTGVYKQNLKLTNYVKKSCKREERFNQIVTMLQGTVNNLESELTEVRQELDEVKRRESELLASLKMAKEKLRKYEAT